MGKEALIGDLKDRHSLAELLRWMNEQPRAPGEEPYVWRHRAARAQLEFMGLRFHQPSGRNGKLYFFGRDLWKYAPSVAGAFFRRAADPEAGAAA